MLDRAKPIRQAAIDRITTHIASADPVAKVGGAVLPPVLAQKQEPEYSEDALATKFQGTVMLSIVVGTDGLAHDIKLLKSLGFGLDEKAAEAVSQWQFKPGTSGGVPVPVSATIEVNFRLL